jgi:predicted ribosomally synthesized peptide with nif11-like leader
MSQVSPMAELMVKAARNPEFSQEIKEATAGAATREEGVKAVVALAKEQGIEIDGQELETTVLQMLQTGELTDADLDQVAGGLSQIGDHAPVGPWSPENLVIITGWAVAKEVTEGDSDSFIDVVSDVITTVTDEVADKAKDAVDFISSIFSGW